MEWLTDWDDLKHGTAVFSAAVPFLVAFLLAWKLPTRWWWIALVGGVVGSFFWLFGLPRVLPSSSEDVAMAGLLISVIAILVAARLTWLGRIVCWSVLFLIVSWGAYPAWLADEGGLSRRWMVCGAMAVSTAIWAAVWEALGSLERRRFRVSPAVFIAPAICLAILLVLGGAARFGQASGAVAAALGALCVMLIARGTTEKPAFVAALWGFLFMLFAWSGWLFAELRYGLAAMLLLAPVAGTLVNLIPLPRGNAFLNQLWDGLASAVASLIPAWIAISDYVAEMEEFEGY